MITNSYKHGSKKDTFATKNLSENCYDTQKGFFTLRISLSMPSSGLNSDYLNN